MSNQLSNFYRFITKTWYQWVEPPSSVQDIGIRSRSRFLAATILVLIPLAVFLGVLALTLSGGSQSDIIDDIYSVLVGIVMLGVTYSLNRLGYYRLAVSLLIGVSALIVFWGALPFDDPTDADFLVYLAIPVLMTYLLLSSRAAFIVACLCILAMLSLPIFVPTLNFLSLLYFQGTFMIIVLLLSWLVNRHRMYVERVNQAALRQSERSLRLITDNMQEIIFYFDTEGKLQYLSPSITTLMGYTVEEVQQDIWGFWLNQIHPDDIQSTSENTQRAIHEKQTLRYEYRIRHKQGHYVWLEVISSRLKDDENGGIVFTCRDVTERKMVQERLYAAEREQRRLAESMRDTAVVLNSSLKLEEVLAHVLQQAKLIIPHDAAWIGLIDTGGAYPVRSHGFKERGLVNEQGLHYPLDKAINLRTIIETGKPVIIENTDLDKNWVVMPEIPWIKSSMGAPISIGNQIIGIISLESGKPFAFAQHDAQPLQILAEQASAAIQNAMLYETVEQHAQELEQHVAERTLKMNRAKLRAEIILAHNTDGIILVRADRTISQVNPAFNKLFGYGVDELIGATVTRLTPADDHNALKDALAKLTADEPTRRLELIMQRKDGTTFWADAAMTLLPDSDDDHMVVCSLRDISPLKQIEDGLRRALEKERELNELKSVFVTTVSHEFRTPLAIIQSSSDLIKHYGERLSEKRKEQHIETIQKQVTHMTNMLQEILTYNEDAKEPNVMRK